MGVEHHFLEEYSHSPCPNPFSRRKTPSQRTKKKQCRLANGIFQLNPNHPSARCRSAVAVLDMLSNGRGVENSGGRRAPRSPGADAIRPRHGKPRTDSVRGSRRAIFPDVSKERGGSGASTGKSISNIPLRNCGAETREKAAPAIMDGVLAASKPSRARRPKTDSGRWAFQFVAPTPRNAGVQRLFTMRLNKAV